MTPDPVFDFYPGGMRFVDDEESRRVVRDELDAGGTAYHAFNALFDAQVDRLRRDPTYRTHLRDLFEEAGVNLVSPTMWSFGRGETAVDHESDRQRVLSRWQARFDAVPWLEKATSPADARHIVDRGNVGVVLNTQNVGLDVGTDVSVLRDLYNAGLRVAQVTYNAQNLLGTGCTERVDGGLSDLGVEVVDELDALGVVVDLSHCGTGTTLDAIEQSSNPVAFTHTCCRAVADHDRGKTDEELDALAAAEGYVGILTIPFFLSPDRPDEAFERFFDHVDHAVSVVGVDRVGIGTDWGAWSLAARADLPDALRERVLDAYRGIGFDSDRGSDSLGAGFGPMTRYTDWQAIPDGLADRGYTPSDVRKLVGGNFLDFWERVA